MAELQFYLFGAPRIEHDGQPVSIKRRKAAALVFYLAMSTQPHNRSALASVFWPESDQTSARSALRTTLASLRRTALKDWLVIDGENISLKRDSLWVDVLTFRALISNCHDNTLHNGDGENCIDLLSQGVALYKDHFLTGFTLPDSPDFDEWQYFHDDKLRTEMTDALQQLAKLHVRLAEASKQARYADAITYVQRWLEIDPTSEAAHRYLMKLYAQTDQRNAALRQYQTCVEVLEREVGIPPQRETSQLYEAIKANKPVSLLDTPAPIYGNIPIMPELVVGREADFEAIKARIGMMDGNKQAGDSPIVAAVQGWPGIGKTTLAAALAHDPDIVTAFPDGVLWASLGQQPNVLSELKTWGEALGDHAMATLRHLDDAVTAMQTLLRDKRMLLIVDDVWEIEHARPFRIAGRGSAVLFTTRQNDVARALATTPSNVYRLPILNEMRALELLEILAPEVVAQNTAESLELVRDLEGLPLALQVAGRLLHAEARLGWGVTDLLTELREGTKLLTAAAPADRIDVAQETAPTVAVLLRYSTDRLDEATRERFAYLGAFAPKPATFELDAMKAVWLVDDPRPTIRILVDRGLLEPVQTGHFQMHALLVMHARSLFEG